MLRNLLQSKEYVLVNSVRNRVKGGPFTRYDPANGKLSLLDLVIVSVGLVPYVREMIIEINNTSTLNFPQYGWSYNTLGRLECFCCCQACHSPL